MEFLRSFLGRRFAGKPVVASGIVDHFLRVLPSRQVMFLHLCVTFLAAAIFTPACILPLLYCPIWKRRTTPSLDRRGFCLVMVCCLNLTGGKAIQCGIWSSSRKIVSQLETSINLIACLIWLRYAMSKKYKVQYTKHTSLILMLFVRKSECFDKTFLETYFQYADFARQERHRPRFYCLAVSPLDGCVRVHSPNQIWRMRETACSLDW